MKLVEETAARDGPTELVIVKGEAGLRKDLTGTVTDVNTPETKITTETGRFAMRSVPETETEIETGNIVTGMTANAKEAKTGTVSGTSTATTRAEIEGGNETVSQMTFQNTRIVRRGDVTGANQTCQEIPTSTLVPESQTVYSGGHLGTHAPNSMIQ